MTIQERLNWFLGKNEPNTPINSALLKLGGSVSAISNLFLVVISSLVLAQVLTSANLAVGMAIGGGCGVMIGIAIAGRMSPAKTGAMALAFLFAGTHIALGSLTFANVITVHQMSIGVLVTSALPLGCASLSLFSFMYCRF